MQSRLSEYYNEEWNNKLESLTIQEKPIWKIAKAPKVKEKQQKISRLKFKNGMTITTSEKVEAVADNLQKQLTTNSVGDPRMEVQVWAQLQDFKFESTRTN